MLVFQTELMMKLTFFDGCLSSKCNQCENRTSIFESLRSWLGLVTKTKIQQFSGHFFLQSSLSYFMLSLVKRKTNFIHMACMKKTIKQVAFKQWEINFNFSQNIHILNINLNLMETDMNSSLKFRIFINIIDYWEKIFGNTFFYWM